MKHAWIAVVAGLALATIPALASEANFERNLTVNGRVELAVSTGSGHIHLTRGSGNQVHISGHVKSNWGANEERVREIAANPPIEQTGNIIRIGKNHENYHNISIDYDIQAPADAFLEASSGSGEINDDGVGAQCQALNRFGIDPRDRPEWRIQSRKPAQAISMRSKPGKATYARKRAPDASS